MVLADIIWPALFVLTISLFGVVKLWPDGGFSKTFSQHVADRRSSVLYYILVFTVFLPMLAIFFYGWFIPYYQLPFIYSLTLAISLVAQYLCTFFPESGRRVLVHQGLALISAAALLVSQLILVFVGRLSEIDRLAVIVPSLIMVVLLTILVTTKARHPKILLVQVGYFAAYFVSILAVIYI